MEKSIPVFFLIIDISIFWGLIAALHLHNMGTTHPHNRYNTSSHEVKLTWEMIKTLTMRNNDTTPRHIGVGSTHWVSPQCTLVLCHCCVQRVQGSLPNLHTGSHLMWGGVVPMLYWCCKSTTNMVLRMSAFRIEQILLQTLCKLRWQFIWH
jgi:hypothetical protein